MIARLDAIELAKDLALKGMPEHKIWVELRKRDLADFIAPHEMEAIILEVNCGRNLAPRRTSNWLPRTVGIIAILLGICGIYIGTKDYPTSSRSTHRYNPAGLGIFALIVGSILVIKPNKAKDDPFD